MSRESTESANVCWKKINVQAQYVCQSVCMYTHDVITCAECSVSCVLPSPQDLPAHFKVLSIIFPFGYASLAVFFKALYFLFKPSQAYATIMKANRIWWSPSKHASEVSRERNDDIGTGTGRSAYFSPIGRHIFSAIVSEERQINRHVSASAYRGKHRFV